MRSSCMVLLVIGAGLGAAGAQDRPAAVPTVDQYLKELAAQAPLRMAFRGASAEECKKWQAEFAAKLRELLGPHAPPKEWTTTVERSVDLPDHRREELVLTAAGQAPLPVYLLIPRGGDAGKRRPGILAIHGHGSHGHDPVAGRDDLPGVDMAIKGANYDYGRQLVRQGYVVAVPCLTPFGRRLDAKEKYGKQDPCGITFIRMQLFGKVLMGENLRACLWAIELLARRQEVDADRLGCVGLSYGGRMTMLTSALEPRIKAAVISGALNVMQERIQGRYSCGAQIIPGLLEYGDVPEIASLIAPRPCLWEVGLKDSLISRAWADKALERIGRAYKALGAADNLQVERFDGGHRWNGVAATVLLRKTLRPQ